MSPEQQDSPQPQVSDTDPQDARAYDDAGNVRPADARFLPGGEDLSDNEKRRAEVRAAEIEAGQERLRKQFEKMGVDEPNPTVVDRPTVESDVEQAAAAGDTGTPATFEDMDYRQLQDAAKSYPDVPGNLPQDELRAALIAKREQG